MMLRLSWGLSDTARVRVYNSLENKQDLILHCKSKDNNDLGERRLRHGDYFQWQFPVRFFFSSELYYCSFQWKEDMEAYKKKFQREIKEKEEYVTVRRENHKLKDDVRRLNQEKKVLELSMARRAPMAQKDAKVKQTRIHELKRRVVELENQQANCDKVESHKHYIEELKHRLNAVNGELDTTTTKITKLISKNMAKTQKNIDQAAEVD
ncbi:leguminosin group486 secreted peptide [Senna tora]|uniref:S-protein homolog n=1 Tax=Senna tora TaxID=362788 RepID=A0A834XIP1_9FABA|nr:leguminosin group486 secreted peptide [Senna tora]